MGGVCGCVRGWLAGRKNNKYVKTVVETKPEEIALVKLVFDMFDSEFLIYLWMLWCFRCKY